MMVVGSYAYRTALSQGEALLEHPVSYFIRTARMAGAVLLVSGTILGVSGYYLKASATAAMNNELNVVGNIGTIFSNVKTPTFSPAPTGTAPVLGSNPLADVQNFLGDAWQDVQAAGSDIAQIGAAIGTLGEDAGIAIADVAKALLAFVTHFPDILWNGLVWGLGGSLADVLNWVFPWLLIFGAVLIAASLIAQGLLSLWNATVGAGLKASWSEFSARQASAWKTRFDRILRNPAPSDLEEAPARALAPVPPPPAPGSNTPAEISVETPPLLNETPGPTPIGAATAEDGQPPPVPAESPGAAPGPILSSPPDRTPEEIPIPAGWTKEETEEYLGEAETSRRDAVKAKEAAA